MQPVPDSGQPAPAPQVTTRVWGEAVGVLFDPDSGQQRTLNETGLAIWRGLLERASVEAVSDRLVRQYDGLEPDQARVEVRRFVHELRGQGFVVDHALDRRPAEAVAHDTAPEELDLSLTGRCNLRCQHCFYADDMKTRDDLPTEPWLEFFDELGRLAVRRVCLTGGEVMARRDLWTLVDRLVENRMRFTMLTNGTLLDEAAVERLGRAHRRTRLENIQVSVDGPTAEVHDRFRSPGSFSGAVRALRLLKEAGLPLTARVTINRYNVDLLRQTAAFLLDELGLPYISTNSALPVGAAHTHTQQVTLTAQERRRAMVDMVQLADEYDGRILANDGPLAQARHFAAMEQAADDPDQRQPWMGTLSACGCVFSKLAVHHDGTIVPCALLSEATLGHINRDPLPDIWRSHPTLSAMRSRRTTPMRDLSRCQGCRWVEVCNGGCPAHPFSHHGELDRPSDFHCYRKYLEEVDRGDAAP